MQRLLIVGLSSGRSSHIDIQWDWDLKTSDDLSIPKAMYSLEVVQDILGKKKDRYPAFGRAEMAVLILMTLRIVKPLLLIPTKDHTTITLVSSTTCSRLFKKP